MRGLREGSFYVSSDSPRFLREACHREGIGFVGSGLPGKRKDTIHGRSW